MFDGNNYLEKIFSIIVRQALKNLIKSKFKQEGINEKNY
jgi:hypothetical protein